MLRASEACDVLLPAQQLDIRVAADDAGCGARHIRQDAVKGTTIPKGRRVADVGHDERRLPGLSRKVFLNPHAARGVDIQGNELLQTGRVLKNVAGLAAGSGDAFALLPPQNASGNWIKIVQRLPVRIEFDRRELEKHPLRIGLSTSVQVDTRDQSGPLLADTVRPSEPEDTTGRVDIAHADALIAGIVAANGGKAEQPQ